MSLCKSSVLTHPFPSLHGSSSPPHLPLRSLPAAPARRVTAEPAPAAPAAVGALRSAPAMAAHRYRALLVLGLAVVVATAAAAVVAVPDPFSPQLGDTAGCRGQCGRSLPRRTAAVSWGGGGGTGRGEEGGYWGVLGAWGVGGALGASGGIEGKVGKPGASRGIEGKLGKLGTLWGIKGGLGETGSIGGCGGTPGGTSLPCMGIAAVQAPTVGYPCGERWGGTGSGVGALGAPWRHREHHGGHWDHRGGTGSTVGGTGSTGGGALGALWGALGAPGGHRGTTMEGHWEHRGGHRGSPGGLLQHWLWGAPGEGIHPGLGCPQWFRPSRLWGAPPGSHPCRLSGGSCSGLGVPPGRPRTPSPVAWQSRPREHRVAQGQRHRGKRVTPWRHGGPAPSHGSGD